MLLSIVKNLFSKPVTVRYPQQPSPPPKNYRGLIVRKEELCIFCTRCEMVCPSGAIRFTYEKTGKKEFHYNPYLCVYCGECVRACPKPGCLTQVEEVAPPGISGTVPDWDSLEKQADESKKVFLRTRTKKD